MRIHVKFSTSQTEAHLQCFDLLYRTAGNSLWTGNLYHFMKFSLTCAITSTMHLYMYNRAAHFTGLISVASLGLLENFLLHVHCTLYMDIITCTCTCNVCTHSYVHVHVHVCTCKFIMYLSRKLLTFSTHSCCSRGNCSRASWSRLSTTDSLAVSVSSSTLPGRLQSTQRAPADSTH